MATTSRAYHDTLSDIGLIARSMKSLCSVNSYQLPIPTESNTTIPPLFLPSPDTITRLLLEQGCPQTAAQTISDTFLRSAHQTRTKFESNYRETCAKLAPYLISDPAARTARYKSLASLVETQYQEQISTIKNLALERFKTHNRSSQKLTAKAKPAFNQEYVPLLEKYFEYNAYPSAPDRLALARKSMMTPRQIEVWFQNHRNRSKKEGRALRRLASDTLPLKLSLESLEQSMPFFLIPVDERKDPHDVTTGFSKNSKPKENDTPSIPQAPCTFSNSAPPHAFPTPYSPSPLATKRYSLPTPDWIRSSSSIRPHRTVTTMEELITDFTLKLVFTERSSIHGEQDVPSATLKLPWFAATHILPTPAPHPAFIPVTTHKTSVSSPTTLTSLSQPHPPLPSSPISHPLSSTPTTTTQRKFANLPRRAPKHRSVAHRETSPATSEASSPASLTSSSRTSSFSSDSSYIRRPSSSSSTSSNASSTLTTPVLIPTSLPENALSPISVSGLDFQTLDDLSNDCLNIRPALDGIESHFLSREALNATLPQKYVFQFDDEVPTSHSR